MNTRHALEHGARDEFERPPSPARRVRDPAPVPLGAPMRMASLLAARAHGSCVPGVLIGLQHTAGNAAVQRIVADSGPAVVQRIWPFDDDEEGAEGGGEGGSEGSGPASTEGDSGGGYGGEGNTGPSGDQSTEGGDQSTEGDGSSAEKSSTEGGSSSWWPFDGGDQSTEDGGESTEDREEPGGGESADETPAEPASDEQVSEETPEETFHRLVAEGANAAALAVVVRSYGYGGKDVASITYNPSLGNDGETSGKPDEPQRISIGPSAFSYYTYCASVIGHEMQHVAQRIGRSPMQSKALREFLAYSWQVIENRNLLKKEDLRANALQAYLAYQAMTENDQFMQQGRYAEVQTLRQQLGAATPTEG